MPTPREAYVNTVERQGTSGARVQAADYGASGQIIARAVQGFGQDVQRVGQDLDDIQTIYAEAAAKDADAQAALKLQALGNGYRQLEQGDAIDGKAKVLEDITALEKEATSGLKNARAQRMFKDVFSRRKLAVMGSIDEHEITQVKKYADAKSLARESASKIVAIDAPTEDEMFVNIETAISEKWSRMPGASTEDKALEAYELRSEVLAKRAQTIRDPIAQEQFRQKHSGMISPDHEAVLVRSNQAGLTDAQAAFRANDFAAWRASGKSVAPQTPGSPITQIDDNGVEVEPSNIVEIDVAPSNVADTKPAAAPRRATTAVVKGANYDPTRGIGVVTASVEQHRARNGGTGRTAIDIGGRQGTALYPPVRGKVVEAPREQRGANGYMVRVDYGDGLVGTYLHLKGPSPLEVGQVVETSQVVGLLGNTGRSTGPHVDYSVTKNGAVVDPNKVTYRGYGGESGPSTLDQYKPEDADTTSLVADVREYAKAAGLSQVEERTLLRDQMEVVNFNRGLMQDKERIADRAADEWLIGIGDRPFKLSEVPGYSELSPASKNSFIQIQEIRSRPKEPAAGGQDYIDAMVTAENDPGSFADMNLDKMALTNEERTRLKIKQGTLKNNDGSHNKSAINDETVLTERMNNYLKQNKIVQGAVNEPREMAERDELRGFIQRQIIALEAQKKRKLEWAEIDTIVQNATAMVWFTKDGKRQEARRYEVSKSDPAVSNPTMGKRDKARYALRKANGGIPVTEQDIDEFIKKNGL